MSGRTASSAAAILPGVSKHTGNLIGYYRTPLFGVRLTYDYCRRYDLAAGGTFAGAARQVKERGQLDASASVNLSDTLSLSIDAFNITNAERIEYENDPLKPRRADFDGRTFQFGVRALF